MKVSTRSVSRNNSAQTLQEGAGFGEELNKEKLFKVLKRIAEMEIRESKLVDRIRELEAEIGEETAPPGLGQGSARLIQLKLQKLQAKLSAANEAKSREADSKKALVGGLIQQMNEERDRWAESIERLQSKLEELEVRNREEQEEKEQRLVLLQKKLVQQQSFIRWLRQQKNECRAKSQLQDIENLYNSFFSFTKGKQ